jgi:hypothetical protein
VQQVDTYNATEEIANVNVIEYDYLYNIVLVIPWLDSVKFLTDMNGHATFTVQLGPKSDTGV